MGIIPLDAVALKSLTEELGRGGTDFTKSITFLNPETNTLETINCIIPIHSIEYYTIRAGNTMAKAFSFTCEEL